MVCTYELIDNILFIRFPEILTEKDMGLLGGELDEVERGYAVIPHRISDLRPVKSFDLKFDAVLYFAQHRIEKNYGHRVRAGLLVNSSYQMGFARMYQTLNDSKQMEIEIFDDEQKAIDWIKSLKIA